MKILFVTSSSINGGAQKHIREMFISLTKLGHKVFLSAPHGWLIDELHAYQDNLLPFNTSKEGYSVISSWMKKETPDITNTFILSGGVMGTRAWSKIKCGKLFVTVNNPVIYDGISWYNKLIYPKLYKWMSKYASAFLVKSDTVRNEVESVIDNKKPVLSIKNGVDFAVFNKEISYPDLKKELGINKDEILVSNVAVLDERKGQKYLIEAITQLRKTYPIHLMIAGEGPLKSYLISIIKQNQAESYIHLLGRRSDINCVLANTDIFVLSSNHEGLPNSLMEAMAMGLPCISTDVGGVKQLITDSSLGLVIPSKSSSAIVSAIEKYITDPNYKNEAGSNAYRSIVNNYDQSAVAGELVSIYENL